MKMVRMVLWALVLVSAGGLGFLLFNWYSDELQIQQTQAGSTIARVGGPFTLTDHTGKKVTDADLNSNKPMAIFFGYTFCPDVCPTTLGEMILWREDLGSDADKINYVFVTVDPERDTPEMMADYVSVFFPSLIGLTGSVDELKPVIRDYRVYAKKTEDEDGDYVMDHTASVYLMKPGSDFMGTISYGESHDSAVAKLRKLIAAAQ